MNAFGELGRAVAGWFELLLARPKAREKFTLTRAGLINAAGFYFAMVLLIIAIESALTRFPGWFQVVLSLLVNGLYLGAALFVTWATARLLKAPALAIAVPVTYAMGLLLGISWIVAYFAGSGALVFVMALRVLMFFRAAREMGQLGFGVSTAFAILCTALLAAIPPGLYMLVTSILGPF